MGSEHPRWENYPLQEVLRTVTAPDIEIYIDSDRTCYMYGEMWQGAAKDCHSAVFIAVGTGIGAGIIIDGHVLHGASDIIGATGWMALQPPYKEEYDACGCFEYYASGNGIGARVRDAVRANKAYKDAYVKNLSAAFPLMMYSAHTMRKIRLQFPYCTKP